MSRIIFYDLETTGLNPENDKIIEIGAKDNYGNEFSKLINPECTISNIIENITGITNEKLKYRNTLEQNRGKIMEFFDFDNKDIYLIAHNGDNFDHLFLYKEFSVNCKMIDSIKLFRKLLPYQKSYSIKNLCNIYNIDTSGHHRALEDSNILEQLFYKGVELYKLTYNKKNVTIQEIYRYIY